MSEQDIQRQIKKWLESKGAHVTKYNANGYGVVGHPDLFVSFPVAGIAIPLAFFVEVKTKTGKISMMQDIYHKKLKKANHLITVARSVEDIEIFARSHNLLRTS